MAIDIKLIDNWRLISDSNNVMLGKEENGRLIIEGYYSTFEDAIKGFVSMKIKGFDNTSLLDLNNSIKSLQEACITSLQSIKIIQEGKK